MSASGCRFSGLNRDVEGGGQAGVDGDGDGKREGVGLGEKNLGMRMRGKGKAVVIGGWSREAMERG